jgi:hypothetical protein
MAALPPATLDALWNILTVATPFVGGLIVHTLRQNKKRIEFLDACVDARLDACKEHWERLANLRQTQHEENIQRFARLEASHQNMAHSLSRVERKVDQVLLNHKGE